MRIRRIGKSSPDGCTLIELLVVVARYSRSENQRHAPF